MSLEEDRAIWKIVYEWLGVCYETGLKAVGTLHASLDRDPVVSLSPLTASLYDLSPKHGKNSQGLGLLTCCSQEQWKRWMTELESSEVS